MVVALDGTSERCCALRIDSRRRRPNGEKLVDDIDEIEAGRLDERFTLTAGAREGGYGRKRAYMTAMAERGQLWPRERGRLRERGLLGERGRLHERGRRALGA